MSIAVLVVITDEYSEGRQFLVNTVKMLKNCFTKLLSQLVKKSFCRSSGHYVRHKVAPQLDSGQQYPLSNYKLKPCSEVSRS